MAAPALPELPPETDKPTSVEVNRCVDTRDDERHNYLPIMSGMCSQDGWCWDNPVPQGQHLFAVWGRRASDVFAVGAGGTALHHDGVSWTREAVGTTDDLVAVQGTDAGLVFALTTTGNLLRRGNEGWPIERRDEGLNGMWGRGSELLAVGDGGLVMRFDGQHWQRQETPTDVSLHAVSGSSAWRIFAVGDAGTVLRFDGFTWKSLKAPTRSRVDKLWVGPKLLIVSSRDGAFVHDGDRWHKSPTGPVIGCWGRADIIRCLADDRTWFLHRADWMVHRAGSIAGEIHGLWSPDGRVAYAVGARGAIYKFSRGLWSEHSDGPRRHTLNAVWGDSPESVWAVGDAGAILHSNGARWRTAAGFPTVHAFADVWGTSDRDIYAVGSAGLMAHFDGQFWQQIDTLTDLDLHAVWGRAPDDIYVVGEQATVLRFDGSSWTTHQLAQPAATAPSLVAVGGSCTGDSWVFGRLDHMWRQRGGQRGDQQVGSWERLPSKPLFDSWIDARGHLYAAGLSIRRFDGQRWIHEASPAERVNAIRGLGGGRMLAVGAGGSILERSGLGVWTTLASGTERTLHDVWAQSPTDVIVVGDGGAILRRRLQAETGPMHAELPTAPRVSTTGKDPTTDEAQ